jgi:hypothetical protein
MHLLKTNDESVQDGSSGCSLTQAAGLALPLKQAEDVALAARALDVADDGTVRVVEELHAHLVNSFKARVGDVRKKEDVGDWRGERCVLSAMNNAIAVGRSG